MVLLYRGKVCIADLVARHEKCLHRAPACVLQTRLGNLRCWQGTGVVEEKTAEWGMLRDNSKTIEVVKILADFVFDAWTVPMN